MTNALKSVVSCEALQVVVAFEGTSFGHAMSKACQYATTNDKVGCGMKDVSIKHAQAAIHKCITWPKKSGKGRQEWNRACLDSGKRPRKLNTPVKTRLASKVIMFEEALQFWQIIFLCYSRQSLSLQAQIPSPQTWVIAEAVAITLSPVVTSCVLNQSRGYWLLSDALHATLNTTLCFQQDILTSAAFLNVQLAAGDFDVKLRLLYCNMRQEVL